EPAYTAAHPWASRDVRRVRWVAAAGHRLPGLAETRPGRRRGSPAHQRVREQVLRDRRRGAGLDRSGAHAAARWVRGAARPVLGADPGARPYDVRADAEH